MVREEHPVCASPKPPPPLFPALMPPVVPPSLHSRPKSHQLLWSLPGSTYRILKGVFLLLTIIVLALFLFLLLVLFYSTVDNCGPRCNRSLLEIMLQPHIQYTRTANAPM